MTGDNANNLAPALPLYAERIWAKISQCIFAVGQKTSHRKSGLVVGGDWDQQRKPISEIPKIHYCLRHWHDSLSWEDAGAFDHMLELIQQKSGAVDGLTNLKDIKVRYANLDRIYAQVKADSRLQAVETIRGKTFRKSGGIFFHLDRKGKPLFGNAGHHRLAIALSLGISHIPAQLGLVHPDAKKVSCFALR
ncbi:MAG: hypothetical protein COB08_015080 [Rhodobacteraceae bacterium]|nr:hypothetical protein [Paracoccaceae bacterium]